MKGLFNGKMTLLELADFSDKEKALNEGLERIKNNTKID